MPWVSVRHGGVIIEIYEKSAAIAGHLQELADEDQPSFLSDAERRVRSAFLDVIDEELHADLRNPPYQHQLVVQDPYGVAEDPQAYFADELDLPGSP